MLSGSEGEGVALAMRVLLATCRSLGSTRLVEIESCHVDSCLYHGQVSLDFARQLAARGARVRVPTTLNVGSVDLLHPANVLRRTPAEVATYDAGRAVMDNYVELGCTPTWTCAPYQLPGRPSLGTHIAWAESNAIVFANSVLGARTERYGDFVDICAGVTGVAPYAGLHTDEGRLASVVFDCTHLSAAFLDNELVYPLLGYLIGDRTPDGNPAILGLPAATSEDSLKALGAAAASAGGVALFHAVGVTPEAPTLGAVLDPNGPSVVHVIEDADLESAREELMTCSSGPLDAVSLGTPHASLAEIRALARLLDPPRRFHPDVAVYLSTGRAVLADARAEGLIEILEASGVRILVDTCTYVTSVLASEVRTAMTNSAKWAHYAPANLGIDVAIGSLEECIESAVRGRVVLRPLGEGPS
jgi:predicted aconitase